jgi:ATP-dependent Lhr-like helicase
MQTTGAAGTGQIAFLREPYEKEAILASLHPYVREWFTSTFKDFSPPQRFSILNIHYRLNTLISSPTGSGKTLSAFLAILNELVSLADAGTLENRVYCVYVSPLKALGNDIEKNLNGPLKAIEAIALRHGKELGIRVGVRTGDTTDNEKAKMLKKTPHIIITTPESLSIMLTSIKFSTLLAQTQWVVLDEIHAIATGKRGVHLSLSLERLASVANFTRVGLSATVAPLEEFAAYLVGYDETGASRGCSVVDVNYAKRFDIEVISPVPNLIDVPYQSMQDALFERLHDLIQSHHMTLVFTNTRSATERVVHQLKDRHRSQYVTLEDSERDRQRIEKEELAKAAGLTAVPRSDASDAQTIARAREERPDAVRNVIAAHHSSLSREHRLKVEDQLKAGELRCVVSSTSLELGIDIGDIDLVVLLGSPKSISRALQRIGRAGHSLASVSKGRILVQDRDDLVECSVLLRAALEKKMDRGAIPKNCLDVLAQTIYGIVIQEQTHADTIYAMVRRSHCFHTLKRADFDSTLAYLGGEFTALEDRNTYAKVWHDKETGMVGRRGKLARLLFMTNTGTIPDETSVLVKIGEIPIGTIAEPFLEKLKRGDVFVLGGETYEFLFARGMVAQVKASAGRLPTVPSWYSEMLPLAFDLASEIQRFRLYMSQLFEASREKADIIAYIHSYLHVDANAANSIYEYFREQHGFSVIPHEKRIVLERFKEGQKHFIVFHTLFGRRVNDALSRAIGYRLGKLYHTDVELGITDNGFFIVTRQALLAKRSFDLVRSDELIELLEHSIARSEVLRRRFRHCAGRSLMILRTYKGQRKSVGKQQVGSQTLLAAVRSLGNDFPILKEARREVLEDLMDAPNAKLVLQRIERGEITIEERFLPIPSPFSFSIVLQGYSDILRVEDRQLFLKRMHEQVLARLSGAPIHGEALEAVSAASTAAEFTYEAHWDEQEKTSEEAAQDRVLLLKQQLYRAARATRLEPDLVQEASRLVEGERTGFSEKFIQWLQAFLSSTIPKAYPDELVKCFLDALPNIQ